MTTTPPDPSQNAAKPQDFRQSVRALDNITRWLNWNSIATLTLVPAAVALFSFPGTFPLGFADVDTAVLARILLLGAVAINVYTFRMQKQFKPLRETLVKETDFATKQRIRAEKFYGLSILDPLTSLYNRRFGQKRLQEEISRAQTSGEPLALLALDFDHFKEINDVHGHAAGDAALKGFARRLQRAIRACDVPIRLGGDEFLVILPECPPDKVKLILSRLGAFEVAYEGKQIPVSFCQGVAQYEFNDTPESLIARADQRLYAQKAMRGQPQADRHELPGFSQAAVAGSVQIH